MLLSFRPLQLHQLRKSGYSNLSIDIDSAARLAIRNVVAHGDTDIFPFPFENRSFAKREDQLVAVVVEYSNQLDQYIQLYPPDHVSSLTPAGYFGYRWSTQLDTIWNLVFLANVLSIADEIEDARIRPESRVIYSYRYRPNENSGDLFDRNYSWDGFLSRSLELANEHKFVLACDISEFYPRLAHHRLENALKHVDSANTATPRIMRFLSHYSNTRSFGLPIGGPAARILSEITLNQIDRLAQAESVVFTRFADDYHIFADSNEDAFRKLRFISEKLIENQGLSLQKSKTRIMSAAEFRSTALAQGGDDSSADADLDSAQRKASLMRFSLRFDPYSPNALENYENLKQELERFDILGLLQDELSKSRIHTSFVRKIISSVRLLDSKSRDEAVLSMLENFDVLYPILSSALLLFENIFDDLEQRTQEEINLALRSLISNDSFLLSSDTHLSFAIRVLARAKSEENQAALIKVFSKSNSPVVKRDIILILAEWGAWFWLSDLRNKFRTLRAMERRAFIAASFRLKDEGAHWRQHAKGEFDPFEKYIQKWIADEAQTANWKVPL